MASSTALQQSQRGCVRQADPSPASPIPHPPPPHTQIQNRLQNPLCVKNNLPDNTHYKGIVEMALRLRKQLESTPCSKLTIFDHGFTFYVREEWREEFQDLLPQGGIL